MGKLDKAITENLNRASCEEKDVYGCYIGSNWNALLFRNFVYRVLNPKEKFKTDNCLKILEKTCNSLGEQYLLTPHKKMLETALRDIKIYVRDLKLAEYLDEMKKIIWSEKYQDRLYSTSRSKFSKPVKIAPGVSGDFYFDDAFRKYTPKKSVTYDVSDSSESENEVQEIAPKVLCGYIRFDNYHNTVAEVPAVAALHAVRDKKPFVFEKWFLGEPSKSYVLRVNDTEAKTDTFYPMEFDFRTMTLNISEAKSFAENTFKPLPEQLENVSDLIQSYKNYDTDLRNYMKAECTRKSKLKERLELKDILSGKNPNIKLHFMNSIRDWMWLFIEAMQETKNDKLDPQIVKTFYYYSTDDDCVDGRGSEIGNLSSKMSELKEHSKTFKILLANAEGLKITKIKLPKYISETVSLLWGQQTSYLNELDISKFAAVCRRLYNSYRLENWSDLLETIKCDVENMFDVDLDPADEDVSIGRLKFVFGKLIQSIDKYLQIYNKFNLFKNKHSKNVKLKNSSISRLLSIPTNQEYYLTPKVKKDLEGYVSDREIARLQKEKSKPQDKTAQISSVLSDITSKLKALGVDCDDISFDTSKTNGSSKAKYKVFSGTIAAIENKIRDRRINLRSFLNTELEAEACEYALQ